MFVCVTGKGKLLSSKLQPLLHCFTYEHFLNKRKNCGSEKKQNMSTTNHLDYFSLTFFPILLVALFNIFIDIRLNECHKNVIMRVFGFLGCNPPTRPTRIYFAKQMEVIIKGPTSVILIETKQYNNNTQGISKYLRIYYRHHHDCYYCHFAQKIEKDNDPKTRLTIKMRK